MCRLIPFLKMASLKTHLRPQAEFSVNGSISPHFNTDKLAEFFSSIARRNFVMSKRIFWFGFCCFLHYWVKLLVCKNSLKGCILHGKGGGVFIIPPPGGSLHPTQLLNSSTLSIRCTALSSGYETLSPCVCMCVWALFVNSGVSCCSIR